ncbi:MAG: type I methionyl aminopeptidase [Actinobacteria bacterium]|nr:type I methionyl aminopeptidase [Actinomycetota bacterium]
MIYRKSSEEIGFMCEGGRILAGALSAIEEAVAPGLTTNDIDALFAERLAQAGAEASFKGYRGFPASICASPNEVIVHGIPNSRPLEEGDIISIDCGVFFKGFHTDSAWTFAVGEIEAKVQKLLEVTEASLEAAIESCTTEGRLGDVGHAVESVVIPAGFSLVREYAGHGVGRALHEEPWIPNFGPPGRRDRLRPGMTIAIEPMVNAGGETTETLSDGWTVVTKDRSLSAHFEHTVAITEDGPLVLTAR